MAGHSSLNEEQEPETLKRHERQPTQRDKHEEDDDLIFVGREYVNVDSEILFVKVISNSKPVISNILNRVTPGSYSKRKKGYLRQDAAHVSQPGINATPVSKAMAAMPSSQSEWRSADSPTSAESSSSLAYKMSSPQVIPPHDSKQLFMADDKISRNPKRSNLRNEIPSDHSSAMTPSGNSPKMDTCTPSQSLSSYVQNGTSFPWTPANEKAPFPVRYPDPQNSSEALVKTGLSSLTGQNKTFDPKKRSLVLLLSDFYYGQHKGNGQLEPKTHSTFKCLSCWKVLKNVKFMNHMKHHLELERQMGDSWENHTTCQHCHRQFPTPFQLQCHIDRVHTTREPSAVCKICELSFETDQDLLQHMKDNHKPGEMPYACQVCNYRSSAFADVETHFRTCHENTKDLLCLFCLKIFKTANSYMNHCWRHWNKKRLFPCSKCRLQFLSLKEEIEHKTKNHQTFKKPEPLEGLPPETEVIIQTSVHPSRGTEFIVVSNTDSCLSPVKIKKRKNSRYSGLLCSQGSS
ncbi:PREDICTED: zinc finger protein 280A [Chinchilla lanigera]|uniref:zinc finger protein 280A n=1 Tax=Chinchilla lanigera TaxID=34839 RepID=UPI00038EAD66|nr:PREDICTED: zinc finger protein 280A [Chinchilla lanigera]XP_005396415.1 PREDICTED: zinc finger protein 280A [Chinchilla lanigera]